MQDSPTWDGSPSSLWSFQQELSEHLYGVNPAYRSLIVDGTSVYKGKIIVINPTHARLVAADLMRQPNDPSTGISPGPFNGTTPAPHLPRNYDPTEPSLALLIPPKPKDDAGKEINIDMGLHFSAEEKEQFSMEPQTLRNLNLQMGNTILELILAKPERKEINTL